MSEIKEIREKVKSLYILVVDDEDKVRTGTSTFMKKIFKSVDEAENGEVALKMFKDKKYDVLLTDIKMPKMNGIELINKIRDIDKEVIIVVATGSPEVKGIYLSKTDMFLTKPISIDIIMQMLKMIVQKRDL